MVSDPSKSVDIKEIIRKALIEDIGEGDHSSLSCIDPNFISEGQLIFKDNGIVAGMEVAFEILKTNDPDCEIQVFKKDGDSVSYGDIGFKVKGNAQSLLKSERLLLNIMQRMSGIATISNQASELIKDYKTKVLDTRKTTPNLRILEKWAVEIGGGKNHRFGLYDMIMLKDNHIDVAGGIRPAIQKAKNYINQKGLNLEIEVETRSIDDVKEVLKELPIKRVMLDNFSPTLVKEAVILIDKQCETEASGGITLNNLLDYAKAGVDFVSLGMLTHSVKSLDISFKIK